MAVVVILGSASPRRREILTSLGVPHVVRPADVDERVLAGEAPHAYLARIVAAKLAAVRALGRGATEGPVLVADTIVVAPREGAETPSVPLGSGIILGKPADVDEAERTIEKLASRTHEVSTRFAIALAGRDDAAHAETVTTRVTFRALEPGESRAYAEGREGFDKAGGYAVQGQGARFVSRIDGSYSNVVGLPACEVFVALRRLGLSA